MKKFAVIKNNIVVNTIVADSQEIAEDVTKELCVEYFDSNPAIIGLNWENNYFEQKTIDPEIID
jgi:hypothetical protein